jgi:hypothetical protein
MKYSQNTHSFFFLLFLSTTGCSIEGDWVGSCTSEDGTRIDFEIDFDKVGKKNIQGDADMDYFYADGSGDSTECEIGGNKRFSRYDLFLDCVDESEFFLELVRDGKVLEGDCGGGAELILQRQDAVEFPDQE